MRPADDSAESTAAPDADMAALVDDARRSTLAHRKAMEVEDKDFACPGPQLAPGSEEPEVMRSQPSPDFGDSEMMGPQPGPELEDSEGPEPQSASELEDSEGPGPQPAPELEDLEGPGPQPFPEVVLDVERILDSAAHYSRENEEKCVELQAAPKPAPSMEEVVCMEERALALNEPAVLAVVVEADAPCIERSALSFGAPYAHMEENSDIENVNARCTEERTLGLEDHVAQLQGDAVVLEANALCIEERALGCGGPLVHEEEDAMVCEAHAFCVEENALCVGGAEVHEKEHPAVIDSGTHGVEVPTVHIEDTTAEKEGALVLEGTTTHMAQETICAVEDVLVVQRPTTHEEAAGAVEGECGMEESIVRIRDLPVRMEADAIKENATNNKDLTVQGAVHMEVDAVGGGPLARAEGGSSHVACTEKDACMQGMQPAVGIQGIPPALDSPTHRANDGLSRRLPEEGAAVGDCSATTWGKHLLGECGTKRLVPDDAFLHHEGEGDATHLLPDACPRQLPAEGDLKRRRVDSGTVEGVDTAVPERLLRKKKDQWLRDVVGPVRKTKRFSKPVEYYQIRIPESPSPERIYDSSSSSEESVESDYSKWVHQFCCKFPQLVKVPTWFLTDNFSMQGLDAIFRRKYRGCVSIILDKSVKIPDIFPHDVYMVYLFAHQRYVQTWEGMCTVKTKMFEGDYGYCLRVLCKKNPLIPVQMSDGSEAVVGFCTACLQCVVHRQLTSTEIPHLGIAYGESFAELLLMNFPKLRRLEEPEKFVPKLFGYRLAKKKHTEGHKPT